MDRRAGVVAVAGWADRRDAFHTIWHGRAAGWPVARALLVVAMVPVLGAVGLIVSAHYRGLLAADYRGVLAVAAATMLGVTGLLVLGDAAAACQVVVRVGVYSVQVRPGLLPFAGTTVPVRSIRSAEVVLARPRPWPGWGWWWRSGPTRAVVVRSGPALRLGLTSGRSLVVSVDQPRQAVAALRRVVAG
jgi:hypothetical protein